MRLLRAWFVLLAVVCGFTATTRRSLAQSEKTDGGSVSAAASKAEVEELRKELAAQRRTIEKLEYLVEHLTDTKLGTPAPDTEGPHLVNAVMPLPKSAPATAALPISAPAEDAEAALLAEPLESQAPKKDAAPPVLAGWNGEHFFIKSADGQFQIQPYGYVQTDYRNYVGDGTPPDTFSVRRARFGLQGNYGDHYQFGLLIDAAPTSSGGSVQNAVLRDLYLNVKYNNALQFQAGQFKEPFAQELTNGVTNIDFVERGLQSLLYPSASSAFRSPGITLHGDLYGGAFQYWAGAFNGKGFSTSNTTSSPEGVGRVRFYPWRNHKDSALQGLAFGGSIAYSQTRGLSNELTPSTAEPNGVYTFLPQFQVNGNVWRYEGEFTYLKGPWGFRDEYVQAFFDRTGVGSLTVGGLGFANLPTVRFKAWNSAATYLLTKERRPENGTPRVKHPVFGPTAEKGGQRGWGAWELALRYSAIQGNEPGIFFNNLQTPQNVVTFNRHTDEYSFGVNWYLNYWVRFQSNVSVDRLEQPSTIGAKPQNYAVFEQRLQYRF